MGPLAAFGAGLEKLGEVAGQAVKEMTATFDRRVAPDKISEVHHEEVGKTEVGGKKIDFDKRVESNENGDVGKKEVRRSGINSNETDVSKKIDVGETKGEPIKNKQDGCRRENEVGEELRKKYPEKEGYSVESEKYLRDKEGNIVKDPVTGEARRIDYVVIKDGKVVDSVEVTSKTADKTEQSAKEARIRENGGNYIEDDNGNLVEIPDDVHTRIERRD